MDGINRKKVVKVSIISSLLVISLVSLFLWQNRGQEDTVNSIDLRSIEPLKASDKIWVISDIHYLSDKLHDQGEKFQFIKKTSAGKDLTYPRQRLEALLWQIEKERPKALLVSGDLTLNGEKLSAEELAGYFKRAEELGTEVYVIPGNHDISDGWARTYEKDTMTRTDQILPKEFASIFAEMGYEEAFSRDEDSLSYAVRPFKEVIFVMIDTNKYIHDVSGASPQTSGKLRLKTYEWLEKIFEIAKGEDARVIPVMHHNLVDHNGIVNKGFTIDQAGNVQDFFFKHQVQLVLTGHVHAQDTSTVTMGEQVIYDIATGSFSTLANPIGEMTIVGQRLTYERKNLLMNEWAAATNQTNQQLLDYQGYSGELFGADGASMAYRQMFEEGWYDENQGDKVADFVARMNARYFDGRDFYREEELADIYQDDGYLLLKEHPTSFLLKYVESILVDKDVDDQRVEILFSD